MSFTYRIQKNPGLLLLTGEGVITQAERMETMLAWLADPDFRPGLNTLCDFSKAESTPSLADIRALVEVIRRHAAAIGRKKLAIVTAKPVTFGVARQFAVIAQSTPLDVEVFSSHDAALVWLHEPSA